jgi:hypothetical protein
MGRVPTVVVLVLLQLVVADVVKTALMAVEAVARVVMEATVLRCQMEQILRGREPLRRVPMAVVAGKDQVIPVVVEAEVLVC